MEPLTSFVTKRSIEFVLKDIDRPTPEKNYIYKYHFNDVAISRTKSEVDKPTDQNVTPCKQSDRVAEVTNESRSKANKSFE